MSGLVTISNKRRTRSIEVNFRLPLAARFVVDTFSGVLLQVSPLERDVACFERAFGVGDRQIALTADRLIKLTDLITLGQIGIEIVFAIPFGVPRDFAVQCQSCFDRQFESAGVDHRQRSRHAGTNRARLRIGIGTVLRRTTAKQFRLRIELHVNFEADD